MTEYKNCFSDIEDMRKYVIECETHFEDQLDTAWKTVAEDEEISYVTLSGPTCAGKTTTAKKLISELSALGKNVHMVSFDDFFKEHSRLNTIVDSFGNERLDFDTVNAIDLESLHDTLEHIFLHRDVEIPIYDFEEGRPNGKRPIDLSPGDIVIFEGIQAVYPEIARLFSEHKYKSIYISVNDEMNIGGQIFSGRDIRFIRRIVRDFKFRGADPDFTYDMWPSVCDNEDKNMTPYCHNSDILLNSVMAYEPGIIKNELLRVLSRVDKNGKYYSHAMSVAECFNNITPIPFEMLPENSLYHEFLG